MDRIINGYIEWWKQMPVMSTAFTILFIIIVVMGAWQTVVGNAAWLNEKGNLKEKAIASNAAKLNYPAIIWIITFLLFAFLCIAAFLQLRF